MKDQAQEHQWPSGVVRARMDKLLTAAEDGGMAPELVTAWRWVLENCTARTTFKGGYTSWLWGEDPAKFFFSEATHFAGQIRAALNNVDLNEYRLGLVKK